MQSVSGGAVVKDISAHAFNSAAISVADNIDTLLTFDSERYDTDGIHSTVSNTGRLTAQTAGKYLVSARAAFAGNAANRRVIYLRLNGVTKIGEHAVLPPGGSPDCYMCLTTLVNLAVGDYVEVLVNQNSGVALNIQAEVQNSAEFMMIKILG